MRYLEIATYHDTQIVSTTELKTHCRISGSEDDDYLVGLEKSAVRIIEEYTNLLLQESLCYQYGNTFYDLNILFKSPALEASETNFSIHYRKDSAWVAFNDVALINNIKPPRVVLAEDATVPTAADIFQAWRATYKVGYAVGAVPAPLLQAIKIMVATMYENRQSVIVGRTVAEIPKTAEYLMQAYKIQTL